MTLDAGERLLSRQPLSKAQLERMSLLFHQLEMPDSVRFALMAERSFLLSIFDLPPEDLALAASDESFRSGIISGVLGFTGLKASDRRLMLETMETAITLADLNDATALEECGNLFSEVAAKAKHIPPKIFCAMFFPSVEKATIKLATQEARRQSAIIAIAAEQYRLANDGYLPEELHELVPEFLPLLSLDPFGGEPLRYKQLPKGFVVYSIGPNLVDDGGKEPPHKGSQPNSDVTFVVER